MDDKLSVGQEKGGFSSRVCGRPNARGTLLTYNSANLPVPCVEEYSLSLSIAAFISLDKRRESTTKPFINLCTLAELYTS